MKSTFIQTITAAGLLAFVTGSQAQITFQKIYPATVHESGKDVQQTTDGGYIIAASTETSIVNDLDIMVVRTNNLGDTLWRKFFGGNLPESPNAILPTADGNYFVLGYTQSAGSGDYDHYLLKINALTGDSIYSRVYGGYGNEEGKEIIPTSDGNYMIVGASNSISFSDNNGQLIKIDPNGNVIWNKYYGGPLYESLRSVKQCSDGGYVIAGKRINSGMSDIFLVRTNSGGDTLWTKCYSEANSLEGKSILVNADGSYTLSVDDSSVAVDSDVRVMNFDSGGNLSWSKRYGGTEKDISKMIQPTTDGGYIVSALSRSFGWVDPDYWLLKLNSVGDTLWTRHFGGTDHEHCYAVRQTSDGGYIAVGHTRSYNPSRIEQIMLVKLNALGEFGPLGISGADDDGPGRIYPNPSSGRITISNVSDYEECKVINSAGQVVFQSSMRNEDVYSIDLAGSGPGLYCVTLRSPAGIKTQKVLVN